MKRIFLAGLAATAIVSSCSDDLATQGGGNLKENTIGASVAAGGTRAAFDKDGKFYWSTGDQLGIWVNQAANANASNKALCAKMQQGGAGTESATFVVVSETTDFSYAVYPYSDDHSLSGENLTYVFPATYTYTKVDKTFFPDTKDGNSFNPTMAGPVVKTSGQNYATLNHLGGVFCIKMAKMPCASGTLVVSSDNAMTGSFTANMAADKPALSNSSTTATDNNKAVTFTFAGATVGQPGIFYVPVPTGTFSNVRLKFYEGNVSETSSETAKVNTVAGSYTIDRTNLQVLALSESTIGAGGTATAATTVENANTSLSSSDNVAITGPVSTSTITVPAASASTATPTKTITLEQVARGANITVAEASGTDASTANAITLSLPHPASDADAANLTINTPNSTTTLASNAGETTIAKVTASTAENTLVVSDGVTIKELVVT